MICPFAALITGAGSEQRRRILHDPLINRPYVSQPSAASAPSYNHRILWITVSPLARWPSQTKPDGDQCCGTRAAAFLHTCTRCVSLARALALTRW